MTEHESFLTAVAPPEVVGTERITEIEQRIRDEESVIAQVNAKVAEREMEVATLESSMPSPPTFDVSRDSLLADVELGKATVDDLVKFDREVFDATKKYDATVRSIEAKTKPLKERANALKKQIPISNRTIDALVAESHRLWIGHLTECAERDGATYREHGEIAFKAMLRVVDYGFILHRIKLLADPSAKNYLGLGFRDFCIPTLGTKSTALPPEKRSALGVDTNLYSVISDENLAKFAGAGSESALLAEFEKAGLKCPVAPAPPAPPKAKPEEFEVTSMRQEDLIDQLRPPDRIFPEDAISAFDPYTGKPE